ncbi:MAG: ferrous iron transport protein A [Myxococcales bacterium]|nr:ferrous iron transport protein A [Myxococcales bacterium]
MNAIDIPLDRLPPQQRAVICAVDGERTFRRRLMEFGFVPGAEVTLRTTSPVGDPLDVVLRGARVSLRRREAASIGVRLLGP